MTDVSQVQYTAEAAFGKNLDNLRKWRVVNVPEQPSQSNLLTISDDEEIKDLEDLSRFRSRQVQSQKETEILSDVRDVSNPAKKSNPS